MDYAISEDIGNFKVQDIGEGSVKIRFKFLFWDDMFTELLNLDNVVNSGLLLPLFLLLILSSAVHLQAL